MLRWAIHGALLLVFCLFTTRVSEASGQTAQTFCLRSPLSGQVTVVGLTYGNTSPPAVRPMVAGLPANATIGVMWDEALVRSRGPYLVARFATDQAGRATSTGSAFRQPEYLARRIILVRYNPTARQLASLGVGIPCSSALATQMPRTGGPGGGLVSLGISMVALGACVFGVALRRGVARVDLSVSSPPRQRGHE